PAGPPVETVAVDQATGVQATAGLVDHTWGMEIELSASGLEDGARYAVTVVGRDGRRHDSGSFLGTGARELNCEMTSAVLREDARAFAVRDAAGRVVIRARLAAV
ncbi:MAG: anti-sigma factor, partial [Actinomycetota bacterium]|nr:anti-sigma factor [Actinomycetota bacterium]